MRVVVLFLCSRESAAEHIAMKGNPMPGEECLVQTETRDKVRHRGQGLRGHSGLVVLMEAGKNSPLQEVNRVALLSV